MHYVDRSRYEAGWACPRKRYWNYHYAGRGIVSTALGVDLEYGKAVHSFVEQSSQFREPKPLPLLAGPDEVTADGLPLQDEWNALYQGHTTVFKQHVLAAILAEYEWVSSEQEMTIRLNNEIEWMARLDGVLRRRADGLYFVLEIKTSSYPNSLMKESRYNFQLLMECASLSVPAAELGGAILLVFDKGQRRQASSGERAKGVEGYRRVSPFTYCYKKDKASGYTEYSLEYKSGWDRVPAWTIPGWLEILAGTWPDTMKAQVQLWPAVSFDADRVESVKRQIVASERDPQAFKRFNLSFPMRTEELMDSYFPQNFSNCENDRGYHKVCPYKDCCFSPNVAKDPIATGDYGWREANHPIEFTGSG